jgi:hypothetical protein
MEDKKWTDREMMAAAVIGLIVGVAGTAAIRSGGTQVVSEVTSETRTQSQTSSAATVAAVTEGTSVVSKDGLTTIVDVPILLWTPGPDCPSQKPVVARKRTTTIVAKQTTSDALKTAVIAKVEEVAKIDTKTSTDAKVVVTGASSPTLAPTLLPRNALAFSLVSDWTLSGPIDCGTGVAVGLGSWKCLALLDVEYSRRLWQTPLWGVVGANIHQFRLGLRAEF